MTLFRSMPRLLRFAILMIAIAATLGVAAAAASPEHNHTGSAANRCDICLVAHTVSYRPGVAIAPLPARELSRTVSFAITPSAGYKLTLGSSRSGRGPPSSL